MVKGLGLRGLGLMKGLCCSLFGFLILKSNKAHYSMIFSKGPRTR